MCALLLLIAMWLPAFAAQEEKPDETGATPAPIAEVDPKAGTLDEKSDRSLTVKDYAEAYQFLQLSDLVSISKQPAKLMLLLDEDEDGALSAEEVSNARRALLKVDVNNDGVLSPSELDVNLLNPAVSRLHKLHRLLDVDGDYQISTQEVVEAEMRLRSMDADGNWMLSDSELTEHQSEKRLSSWLKILNLEALAKAGREAPLIDKKSPVDMYYLLQQTDFDKSLVVGGGTKLMNVNREIVHQWPSLVNIKYGDQVELLENGLLLRTVKSESDNLFAVDAENAYRQLELVDWNGNVIWEYRHCAGTEYCLYGPVIARQNGNVIVMTKTARKNTAGLADELEISILEIKPDYENKSTEVVASWPIERLPVRSGDTAEASPGSLSNQLAYTEEQEQFLISNHSGEKLWVIERVESGSGVGKLATGDAYEIDIAALFEQEQIKVQNRVELLEVHWLSDLPGKGDVALLLGIDTNQLILELALPINRNGTYASDGRLEVVRRLDVLNEHQVTGVRPSFNGEYQLILGNDSQVEIDLGDNKYEKRLYGKGVISDLKIYRSNYAAFNDKESVQANLAQNVTAQPTPPDPVARTEQPDKEQLTGIWSMMIETTIGDESSELTLVQDGELIAGSLDGEPLTIALDGNNIELVLERAGPTGIVTIIYNGIFSDAEMYGEYSMATGPTIGTVRTWTARR